MPAVSIVLLNQKGGVGKTSTCHHLAGTLAKDGKKVLLVDNDPQASLTQGLFGPQATRGLDPAHTVAAVYADNAVPEQIIHRTEIAGIDLVPGSRHAMKYNNAEPWTAGRDLQVGLREVVEAVRDRYDMVLIDCPPNLHLCSWAALVASDCLIVPLQPEDYGAQGIIDVQESASLVTELANPGLWLLGYLITMFNGRKSIHKMYEETLRGQYGDDVLATRIPHAAEFPEAIAFRKPVAQYKPKGAAARAIQSLADEILARLDGRRGHLGEAA
jgi:chromosome partitioning protein